jgi:hypothetical protein
MNTKLPLVTGIGEEAAMIMGSQYEKLLDNSENYGIAW